MSPQCKTVVTPCFCRRSIVRAMVASRLWVSLTMAIRMMDMRFLAVPEVPEDCRSTVRIGRRVKGCVTDELITQHRQHETVQTEASAGPFMGQPVTQASLVV